MLSHFPLEGETVPVIGCSSEAMLHLDLAGRSVLIAMRRSGHGDQPRYDSALVIDPTIGVEYHLSTGEAGFYEEEDRYYCRPDESHFDSPKGPRTLAQLKSMERAFGIIKPDAICGGQIGNVMASLEAHGFVFEQLTMRTVQLEDVLTLYCDHREKPYFEAIVRSMADKRIMPFVVRNRQRNAIRTLRALIGHVDAPAPHTIRGKFKIPGSSSCENLIHSSDSISAARAEAILFGLTID